ncbi:FliM/FliN family flagellar motor switch protein [Sphingomonas sanguinis]|uniref:FliM/FliN family flagellar motor switch protein n=1 Tax=Sphingomonas sanguinis TaxID=33051 RepID=UPI001C59B69F|nr:FliM/FliN family flagellar motor switch protein [Sphingomonas sanguinis]QXT34456.1 FliM/FliN family flagellar motor switch protein [Sphingomonas sanguinis]
MTPGARTWLPVDTVPPASLRALLAEVVEPWSARWFAGEGLRLSSLRREGGGPWSWRSLDAGLMLGTTADTMARIGARMLGVDAEDRAAPDRALLEEVAEDCLVDLRARLAQVVAMAPDAEWRPVVRTTSWVATIGTAPLSLGIALTDTLFAQLVLRVLPPAPAGPLGSGMTALAATPVTVSAAVGRAELSVADLRALEIGDVIVLDRPLAEPVPLAVDGHALPRGTARIVAAEPPFLDIVQAATPA